MPELKANIDEPYYSMLHSFKPVAETLMEEELDFGTYVNMVVWRGIRGMMEDIVPRDPETLWDSILLMHESNPEFVAAFINDMLKKGAAREGAKGRIGFVRK